MTTVQLIRPTNKIPAVGTASRVVKVDARRIREMGGSAKHINYFLMQNGLRVEQIAIRMGEPKYSIHLASWAEAEKAIRLLAKGLPGLEISYDQDPCEAKKGLLVTNFNDLLRSLELAGTERRRGKLGSLGLAACILFCVLVLSLAYKYVNKRQKAAPGDIQDESELPATTCSVLNMGRDRV